MSLLIIGIILWCLAHFFKRVAPQARIAMNEKLGVGPARGVMSVLILVSVVLMVVGYRAAPVDIVFEAPSWTRHLNNLLMLVAVAMMGMGASKGRARTWLRHPMLVGVMVWSAAHIMVNGDVASIVLFGSMAVWAMISIRLINMREGAWERPEPGPAKGDVKLVIISLVMFAIFSGIHIWIGPSPFGA